MAFSTTIGDSSIDDLGFRNPQAHQMSTFNPTTFTPLRSLGESTPLPAPDARSPLQRRFTTESMKPPYAQRASSYDISALQRVAVSEPLDLAPMRFQKAQALEKKKQDYEKLQEHKRRVRSEMERLEMQELQDEEELRRMAQELTLEEHSASTGNSEPTTPPEFRDSPFSAARSKPFLASSALATPPSLSRHEVPPHQLITPPAEDVLPMFGQKLSSKSVPGSRRNSDENEFGSNPEDTPLAQRMGPRNPVSNGIIPRSGGAQNLETGPSVLGMLFDDEVDRSAAAKNGQASTSPGVKTYLQMNSTDDKFPILVRRDSYPNILSASSAALDLAVQKNSQSSGWPSFARHRPGQQSLPVNSYPFTPTSNSSPKVVVPQTDSPAAIHRFERGSADLPFVAFTESHKLISGETQSIQQQQQPVMPKLQSSFSTSDIPTLRTANNTLGRGSALDRHRREPSNGMEHGISVTNAASLTFGPPLAATMAPIQPVLTSPGITPLPSPGFYAPYVNVTNPIFHAAPFGAYPVVSMSKVNDTMQSRPLPKRNHDGETNRYAATNLMDHVNEIYSLCKDQHGCRYLQKKLEEKNPQYVEIIFQETHAHVVELMTDPFGNYLCQKLLEYANDEQRTILVNNAAPQLVKIALNQHGTRALQKMIEYLSTSVQIRTVVNALKSKVVELIQDLNGNHVIQKCLNRLSPEDAQFIFDAVGEHCVPVGTHRHGCCVLQRCIDHASGVQKVQLISQITANAFHLVQDPFGNYVVQYILDQEETKLAEQLINRFLGNVCQLSKQKFSSNVIEKCIRVAEQATKKRFIEEMLNPNELEKLIKDSYANYVIQTALDYADPTTRQQLVENIKPILPSIRTTPYGRRIQSKIQLSTNQSATYAGNNPAPRLPTTPNRNTAFNTASPARPHVQQQFPSPFRPTELGPAFTFA